jgi:hypothetical protein
MACPWILLVGSLRLSAYRVVLICLIVPCLMKWLLGGVGRIRSADIAVLTFCTWCAVSLVVNHGLTQAIQPGGILFVEAAGAYFLGRCYIRDADAFRNLVRALFWVVAALLPLALIESVSGYKVALRIFGLIAPTLPDSVYPPRWGGLYRAQTVLDHPILFGVFCSSIFAMTHMVLGYERPFFQRWIRTVIVGVATLLSLSSGPLTSVAVQASLLVWNWLLHPIKQRWKLLWFGIFSAYAFVACVSNRSVAAFYVTRFSFDRETAYFRLIIWEYGTGSVLRHPLFGTGLGEWDRPSWMPPSIDMFWLANAVFYGLPAALLMAVLFLSVYIPASLNRGLDRRESQYRTAYLIAMTGFFVTGWAVHFWNATFVLFMLLLGSGVWLLETRPNGRDRDASERQEAAPAERCPQHDPSPIGHRGSNRSIPRRIGTGKGLP